MAVMCIGKMIVVGLLVLAVVLLFMLAAAIIYFVCKIPGIGPLLLFIAHPILVVCAGLLFFSIGFVFMPLVAPSLWDGNSVKQAIAKLMAIVKSRFMLVIINFIVLWLLVSIITFIVASIVFSGFTSMTGLAAMVLGSNVNVNLMQSATQLFAGGGVGGGGGGEGYLWAATFSASIIFMVAVAMGIQVWLMGINLVYLNVSAGIDSSHAEALLDDQINHAKERAREAKQKAMEASERAKQKAVEAAERAKQSANQAQPSSSVLCPNCDAAVSPDDIFCESCGHKLK